MNISQQEKNDRQIEWRREKVLALASDGYGVVEISNKLSIPHPTISRDMSFLRKQSTEKIHKYIDERVPFEYQKTLAGIEGIIKSMSKIIESAKDNREIMNASTIKMQAYDMKMELVSSASVVQEAIDLAQKHRALITQNIKVLKANHIGSSEST